MFAGRDLEPLEESIEAVGRAHEKSIDIDFGGVWFDLNPCGGRCEGFGQSIAGAESGEGGTQKNRARPSHT